MQLSVSLHKVPSSLPSPLGSSAQIASFAMVSIEASPGDSGETTVTESVASSSSSISCSCSPGYACGCHLLSASSEPSAKRKTTSACVAVAPPRKASKLAAKRLDLDSIRWSLESFALQPDRKKWCCTKRCIRRLIDGDDTTEGFGGKKVAGAVLLARQKIYAGNANAAHTALRQAASRCRDSETDRFDWKFFHHGSLGDVREGVPCGIQVKAKPATHPRSCHRYRASKLVLLIKAQKFCFPRCA